VIANQGASNLILNTTTEATSSDHSQLLRKKALSPRTLIPIIGRGPQTLKNISVPTTNAPSLIAVVTERTLNESSGQVA
jgi:hypothetical protein